MQPRLDQYDWSLRMSSWKFTKVLRGLARAPARIGHGRARPCLGSNGDPRGGEAARRRRPACAQTAEHGPERGQERAAGQPATEGGREEARERRARLEAGR